MKTQHAVGILIFIFLAACNSVENNAKPAPGNPDSLPAKQLITEDTHAIPKAPPDTVARLIFTNMGTQEVKGIVKPKGPKFVCHFTVPASANLNASILTEKKDCNIRIINIILPGNKMEGPYGRELTYKLPVKGDYQLVVGNNLMAGDPETCEFVLRIKLE